MMIVLYTSLIPSGIKSLVSARSTRQSDRPIPLTSPTLLSPPRGAFTSTLLNPHHNSSLKSLCFVVFEDLLNLRVFALKELSTRSIFLANDSNRVFFLHTFSPSSMVGVLQDALVTRNGCAAFATASYLKKLNTYSYALPCKTTS